MLIYKIELFDGRMYIGQTTTSLAKRIQAYKRDVSKYLNGKYKHRSKIIRALAKYGLNSFRIFQIDTASSQEELDRKERFWISVYNSNVQGIGFNIQLGGFGVGKHSDETKKIMSEKKKGLPAHNKGKPGLSGENVGTAVLTQIQADQIREEYKTIRSSIKLAKKYSVSKPTILNVLNNKTYKTALGPVVLDLKPWYVYMIQSSKDGTIYTGITLDVEARLKIHNEGRGARYTKGRGPFIILKTFEKLTKSDALKLEYKIKQLPKEEKLKGLRAQDILDENQSLKEKEKNKMKENFTSINVIMDASGSMQHLTTDTIGSFNTFLAEQKAVPGEAVFTLCRFNTDYSLIHDFIKLGEVPNLDSKSYAPTGGTALLDAMGATMESVGTKLAALSEEERPSKVIFLIITDGHENSSRRFSSDKIKEMVEHQKEKYSWEFVFMGANIDSITAASRLGVDTRNSLNYVPSAAGTAKLYSTVSENMIAYRSASNSSSRSDFLSGSSTTTVAPNTVNTVGTTSIIGTVTPVGTGTPDQK